MMFTPMSSYLVLVILSHRYFVRGFVAACVAACILRVGLASHATTVDPEPDAPPVWANPLDGGAIDVGVLLTPDGAADLDALTEQLELDVDVVTLPKVSKNEAAQAEDWVTKARDLRGDVLLVAGLDPAAAPEALRDYWKQALSAGRGIVFIRYGGPAPADVPALFEGLDPKRAEVDLVSRIGPYLLSDLNEGYDHVSAYETGAGRIVDVAYWNGRPRGHALLPLAETDALNAPMTKDNYISLVAGALRWAARREPDTRIQRLVTQAPEGPQAVDTPPQLPRQFIQRLQDASYNPVLHSYTLVLDRPATRRYTVRVRARYPLRDIAWSYTADETVPKGARRFDLAVPSGLGNYFIDCWLVDGDDVVDWYTEAVRVEGWPEISNVRFSKHAVRASDVLEVRFDVRRIIHRPQSSTAFVYATDALGRRVAEERVAVDKDGGAVRVELAFVDLMTPYLNVEVFVVGAGVTELNWWLKERAAYASAHVLVDAPLRESFQLVVDAPADGGFWARSHRQELVARGVNRIYPAGANPALGTIGADGLRLVAPLTDSGTERCAVDFSPTSPEGFRLREAARQFKLLSQGLYALRADGDRPAEATLAPACVPLWRAWLQAEYASLANLNAAWRSTYDTWDRAAAGAGEGSAYNLAMRADLFRFHKDVLRAYRRKAEMALQDVDPQARFAIFPSSPGTPDVVSPDHEDGGFVVVDEGDEAGVPSRQWGHDGVFAALRAPWPPEGNAIDRARWLPWHAALNGFDALWLSGGYGGDAPLDSALEADEADAALMTAIDRVREGYSALFRGGAPQPNAETAGEIVTALDYDGVIHSFAYGAARMHVFLRPPDAAGGRRSVRYRGAGNEHVYNPLDAPGEASGAARERLAPGDVACFTVLPYEVSRVAIDVPENVTQGRRLPVRLAVKTRGDLPGDHVLHLQLFNPDGERLRHYERAVVAKDGSVETYIPLAFNETLGEHRLVVRDALTGVRAEASVQVR